jgi:hypothetical protein
MIEALAAIGADTADAERILKILEESQNTHLAEMMRALNALDDMPADGLDSAQGLRQAPRIAVLRRA